MACSVVAENPVVESRRCRRWCRDELLGRRTVAAFSGEEVFASSPDDAVDSLKRASDQPELVAALQREQQLIELVERQRAEIDQLRTLINGLRLTEALRGMDLLSASTATPDDATSERLQLAMKRLRVE